MISSNWTPKPDKDYLIMVVEPEWLPMTQSPSLKCEHVVVERNMRKANQKVILLLCQKCTTNFDIVSAKMRVRTSAKFRSSSI